MARREYDAVEVKVNPKSYFFQNPMSEGSGK